jgi:hypothetical protein
VHASDADGVARFEFFVDDQVLGTVAAADDPILYRVLKGEK